ncbi:NDP-sugar epimerase, includes UDP-GlcNAc-inverting 4,6-dehydratase FlaA1 and capsular polysaccharide biosynthesis protein EpsC [Plantibacter sp. VKM Ac-1784]|uniref:NDP-sugar epimerase, includes UDP-GlcNAc-inverting 4,6-dehydratase FlaA1 and capsular polysaccharide biosynthesis protein EpsC n=1 Tax=Plantibacter elymi (nom. nud.) TaxID=199708 RepID=A0ABY1RDM8_9MICO|nr:nucleoside-diphosphate sugar epimerase/dehydratase [Plantibacter sp. VKM Ac-1784]SMQ70531.1 NDP-sugar epimerase, includes UDP-GlcNAc-inverting 4,6-dehydratase FlaA1 and capsular polysaccharide biosynthesis protein EpsC [Plantibacter sp. VKM Ac-1784]
MTSTLPDAPRRWTQAPGPRFAAKTALDALCWVLAIVVAQLVRFELEYERVALVGTVLLCVIAVVAQFIVAYLWSYYHGLHSFGSFYEAKQLIVVALIVTAILIAVNAVFGVAWGVPRSTTVIAFPFAIVFMGITRYVKRLFVDSRSRPIEAQRVLVYGAGALGMSIIPRLMRDPQSPYLPVGVIDDDPSKRNFRIASVAVVGTGADLVAAVKRTGAQALIISIADVDNDFIRQVSERADEAKLRVLVVPPIDTMLAPGTGESAPSLRDLNVEDFIGRNTVDLQVESIAGYLTGKRVLVTGAGGSIGSEIARQVNQFGPAELVLLDRDETGLHTTQLSISGHGLLDTKEVVLADIRDLPSLMEIFEDRRPDVVFHAAALKHAPMLEQYPDEAWKNNVLGTLNVLNAARAVGVGTFVNISTDKAANPTTVLGYSKRIAEKLTAWMSAQETDARYLSVRFGNVIGSRGSAIPAFTAQIEAGGPVTVTHPDVTRFFMTIPEASKLVIQAGAIGDPGEVLILDMGRPVRILDVAKRMIAASGKDVEIVYTGLRHGEKLHEVLIDTDEIADRSKHPKVSHTRIQPLDPALLDIDVWRETIADEGAGTHHLVQ